jgi:hypothetical protein
VNNTGSAPTGTQSEAQNGPMPHRTRDFILLAALAFAASALSVPPSPPPKVSFSLSGASSDLVLSSDETRVLVTEHGTLKAVDLVSGSVLTFRKLPAGLEYGRLAVIPNHDEEFAFAAQYGDSKGPHRIWIGHLSVGEDIELALDESGSDGALLVSPSGRYIATGTKYSCLGGSWDCFADAYSVFSTQTGKLLFSTPMPSSKRTMPWSEITGEADPSGGTVTRRDSLLEAVGWGADDVFVVQVRGRAGKAFARGPSGWKQVRAAPFFQREVQAERVYSAEVVDLVTAEGIHVGMAPLASYFGPEFGVVSVLRGRHCVVLFKVGAFDSNAKTNTVTTYRFTTP